MIFKIVKQLREINNKIFIAEKVAGAICSMITLRAHKFFSNIFAKWQISDFKVPFLQTKKSGAKILIRTYCQNLITILLLLKWPRRNLRNLTSWKIKLTASYLTRKLVVVIGVVTTCIGIAYYLMEWSMSYSLGLAFLCAFVIRYCRFSQAQGYNLVLIVQREDYNIRKILYKIFYLQHQVYLYIKDFTLASNHQDNVTRPLITWPPVKRGPN